MSTVVGACRKIISSLSGLSYEERIKTLFFNLSWFPSEITASTRQELQACLELKKWVNSLFFQCYANDIDISDELTRIQTSISTALGEYYL